MRWCFPALCLLSVCLPTLGTSSSEEDLCDEHLVVDPSADKDVSITSPGYPNSTYVSGSEYTWCISSVDNSSLSLYCDTFDIPKSDDCEINALVVSYDNESKSYCGSKEFSVSSSSSEMTVKMHSSKKSRPGKFSCRVEGDNTQMFITKAIVYDNCDCGYSYRLRIVGGQETGINEFPFMAGLVDARRGAVIVCGATIISPRYLLTADHCLSALTLSQTGVVVGEHNTTTGSETSATALIKAKRFIPYPYYDSNTNQYDIALIEVQTPITFNMRVGPVCLPIASRNWDLTGEVVTALGWGTTEFGGPRSKVLKKTNLDIYNIQKCIDTYGSQIEPYTQLCTYRPNTDACQYDSGGPLLWFNYYTNRYEIVGLISYGRGCATPNTPSVNTKVAPFLQWIFDNTQSETYCSKNQS